jgi:hypothetical protein
LLGVGLLDEDEFDGLPCRAEVWAIVSATAPYLSSARPAPPPAPPAAPAPAFAAASTAVADSFFANSGSGIGRRSRLKCARFDAGPQPGVAILRRRDFITLIGGAAATWPQAARAQQPDRARRIGVLMNWAADDQEGAGRVTAFAQGLQELGWSLGRNIRIDYRWTSGDADRIRRYAAELVALAPDVILTDGGTQVGCERSEILLVRGRHSGVLSGKYPSGFSAQTISGHSPTGRR